MVYIRICNSFGLIFMVVIINFYKRKVYSTDNEHNAVGLRLRELRKYFGLNQTEMAASLDLGQAGYSDLERGKSNLSFKTIKSLQLKYNVDLNWLFSGGSDLNVGNDRASVSVCNSPQILCPHPVNAGIPFAHTQEWLSDPLHVSIPGVGGSLVVFLVDGISMMPGVEPGCYLGCRKLADRSDLKLESTYVVVARHGLWLKRLSTIRKGRVTLASDNADFPSFEVEEDEIYELFLPIVKITPYDPTLKSPSFMDSYIQFLSRKV